MSLVKSFTVSGVLDGKQNVVFGISASSVAGAPPPTGPLVITVRDDAAVGGSGVILARFIITPEGGDESVIFPAGVRCTNGVAITLTQPTGAGAIAHTDVVVVIDYS